MDAKNIGKRIKDSRLKKQLKQNELANKLNITLANMCDYEKGSTIPSIPTIAKIANELDVTIDYLVFGKLDKMAENEIIDKELLTVFKTADKLTHDDKKVVSRIIKSLTLTEKVQSVSM